MNSKFFLIFKSQFKERKPNVCHKDCTSICFQYEAQRPISVLIFFWISVSSSSCLYNTPSESAACIKGSSGKKMTKYLVFIKKLINIKIKITVKLIADNWGNKQQSSSYFHFCIFQRQKQTHIVSWFSVQPRNWLSDRTFLWAADVFRPKHFEAFHRLTSTHPDVRRRLVLLWIKG